MTAASRPISHSDNAAFGSVVNATGDVDVRATAQETVITVAAGLAGSLIAGVAGSASVLVMDTDALAAISGDVEVDAGGNVLVGARDDTHTWSIAGGVGVGLGGGGAGAVAVTVITKQTEAVIGGGAAVDADGRSSGTVEAATGATDADGTPLFAGMHGIAVQARSSEDVFALGASVAGGLFVGVAGAVSVEVIDSDTLENVIGGAELNQRHALTDALPEQAVNVSATNTLKVLSIDGSVGVGIGGVGASVDVGVIRNDTTAIIGGAGTEVRARGDLDVNAIAKRNLSSNTISVGAGGLGLAGSISVYSVGGNFGSSYTANDGTHGAKSQDALDGGSKGSVTGSVEGTTAGLVGGFTQSDSASATPFGSGAVDAANDTLDINSDPNRKLHEGDQVVYHNGGGTDIGGLTDGKTYIVHVADPSSSKLSLIDGVTGQNVDLTGSGGSSNNNSLTLRAASLGNMARGDVSASSPAGEVSGATGATSGVSSGTTAAILSRATVTAKTVDVNARNHTELDLLTGGIGLGLGAGIGLGIVVATVDSDVSAFVAQDTIVNGIDANADGDGNLTVNAQLDSTIRSLGFAGAAGGFVGLGSAVSVVSDTSSVRALLGASVDSNGNVVQATGVSGGAEIGATTGFANVAVTADATRTLRIATGAGGISAGAGLGIAVTVGTVTGPVEALVGDYAEIGSSAHQVGNVTVQATGTVAVKPFSGDSAPMGIALSGGLYAGSAGITIVQIGADDAPLLVSAEIGDHATLDASGDVLVTATTTYEAIVRADGGAIGAIAIGAMVARSDVVSTTEAGVKSNARVNARSLKAISDNTSDSTVGTVSAAGGIGAGIGSAAVTYVTPTVTASIDNDAMVTTSGDVQVEATSIRAKAGAAGQGFSISGGSVGVMISEAHVTPTVHADIGDNATVTAGGKVDVHADILAQTTHAPLDDFFQPATDVDTSDDTIHFDLHGLSTGTTVTYSPNGNTAITTDDSAGGAGPALASDREYKVIVVDGNTIKLGSEFASTDGNTGDIFSPQSGVDPLRDRIRFDTPHLFQTGDAVKYSPEGDTSLNSSSLDTSHTYYVRVIDDFTIKLFASHADAIADPSSFDPATSSDTVTADNFIHLSGFTDGEAVTYYAPALSPFSSLGVDTDGVKNGSYDQNQPAGPSNLPITDVDNDSIFLGKDLDHNGTFETGSGFANGDKVIYRTNGTATGGLTNGDAYYTLAVDANKVQLVKGYAQIAGLTFDQIDSADDQIVRGSGSWSDDGFQAGDQIVITGTASNNETLTINSISGDGKTLFFNGPDVLTDETHSATVRTPVLALSPDKSAAGQMVQHALVRQPLGVLQDGVTYYVINSASGKFQLAASPLSTTPLDVSDTGRGGTHAFGKAGIELSPTNGPLAFDPGVASVISSNTFTIANHGLTDGEAVVYNPAPPLPSMRARSTRRPTGSGLGPPTASTCTTR